MGWISTSFPSMKNVAYICFVKIVSNKTLLTSNNCVCLANVIGYYTHTIEMSIKICVIMFTTYYDVFLAYLCYKFAWSRLSL